MKDVVEAFWKRVEKTDTCWNWKGSTDARYGIPRLKYNGVWQSARHLSLQIGSKQIHSRVQPICKNKLCVNPSHLVRQPAKLKKVKLTTEERFWSKVYKTEDCWIWTAALGRKGYGLFRAGGKLIRATHYSWELFAGRPVPKGILICHTCDHPWCVNPAHLFLGTNTDNARDREQKGRGRWSRYSKNR